MAVSVSTSSRSASARVLAHRRPDARGRALRRAAGSRRTATWPHRARAGRSVRLAGADRPRPRHRQGGADGSGGRLAERDRPGRDPAGARAHPRRQAHPPARQARDRLRREARPDLQQAAEAAAPPQRHALHRLRRRRRRCSRRATTTRSAAASWSTRTRRRKTASSRTPPRCPTRSTAATSCCAQCETHGMTIAELMLANEQALAHDERDPPGPARDLAGDAGLRRARHPRRTACCPAA